MVHDFKVEGTGSLQHRPPRTPVTVGVYVLRTCTSGVRVCGSVSHVNVCVYVWIKDNELLHSYSRSHMDFSFSVRNLSLVDSFKVHELRHES